MFLTYTQNKHTNNKAFPIYYCLQKKGVYVIISDFLITIAFQSNVRDLLTFQTFNSVRSNSLHLKYQGFFYQDAKLRGLTKLNLWQKFNSSISKMSI